MQTAHEEDEGTVSQNVEVAVVGAGMFGSAAAKYLSRAGADVTVIGPAEPRSREVARLPEVGAHGDEARIVRRMGWDRVWGAFDARSVERFRGMEAESGVGFFHECGALALIAESMRPRTEDMLRRCAADQVPVERLPSAVLRRALPGLGLPPLAGGVEGLWERESAGYVNPRRLLEAQLKLAVAAGGRLLRGSVTALRRDEPAGLWRLRAQSESGTVEIGAEKVLVAAGSVMHHGSALPLNHGLALHAFTEPNLLFEVGAEQLDHLRDLPTVVTVDPNDSGDDNLSHYLLPPVRYPDGRWYVRIGPGMQPVVRELRTARETLSWYNGQRITPRQSALLSRAMRQLVPGLKPRSVRAACCVIDKTPSRYPYIGHLDGEDSLAVAVGGNGHGARGSDEIGRLASRVLLGQTWDFPAPPTVFAPAAAPRGPHDGEARPEYLTPPFGLC